MTHYRTIYSIDFSSYFTIQSDGSYLDIMEKYNIPTSFWITTPGFEDVSLVVDGYAICRKNNYCAYFKQNPDPDIDYMTPINEEEFYAEIKKYFYRKDFEDLISSEDTFEDKT